MLVKLFFAFFQIGLFSFGGGYAVLAYLQEVIVRQNKWLDNTQYIDLITLSQMTPGPISINSATFVGMKVAGVFSAIVATLGFVLPTFMVVFVLSVIYYKYKNLTGMQLVLSSMRPAVVALITSVVVDLLNVLVLDRAIVKMCLLGIALILLRKYKCNPIIMIMLIGVANLVLYYVF